MKRRNVKTSKRQNPDASDAHRAAVLRLHSDQRGSVMLEHALLLAAFTLPMYAVLGAMVKALGTYYGMMTFFGSVPFF